MTESDPWANLTKFDSDDSAEVGPDAGIVANTGAAAVGVDAGVEAVAPISFGDIGASSGATMSQSSEQVGPSIEALPAREKGGGVVSPAEDAAQSAVAATPPPPAEPIAPQSLLTPVSGGAPVVPAPGAGRLQPLADTVWARLDRKAGAIVEFTIRQLRIRTATWVVGGIGILLMALLVLVYADELVGGIEPIDNDGDSHDYDGDGYPMGQERKYGTSDWDASDFPGSGVLIVSEWIPYGENRTGNQSYSGEGFLDADWVNTSAHNRGYGWIDMNDISECDNEREGWIYIKYGDACNTQDGRIRFSGRLEASGTVSTEGWLYLERGFWREGFEVEPEPASMYIDEDPIDWNGDLSQRAQGFDDDGDCFRTDWELDEDEWWYNNDTNGDRIPCNVLYYTDLDGDEITRIAADPNVDEDPKEGEFIAEAIHRGFVAGVGKIAFIFLLGLFIPLFLATGLIREEMEAGTMHYLIGKPIHRGEFFTYRIAGFMALAGPYILGLAVVTGVITGFLGPGDQLFRFNDLIVWFMIGLAAMLALLAYGTSFAAFGVFSKKYGMYIAIAMGIWEFMMAMVSLTAPTATIGMLSVSHWAIQIVDAGVMMGWPDTLQMSVIADGFGWEADLAISAFWNPPAHTKSAPATVLLSTVVLLLYTFLMILIGQSSFGKQELD